jgi:RHS repeat-associated protein
MKRTEVSKSTSFFCFFRNRKFVTPSVFSPKIHQKRPTTHDHLGSILTVTDKFGGIVAEQNFDAWGRKRNFATWDYAGVQSVPDWLYRGFTGHEHLAEFGLINMNARLYDPILGRMLSPDNLVGSGSQGFNRYSYANNNPLKFVDPDGNNPLLIAMAIYGGVNLIDDAIGGKINNFDDGLKSFGLGAVQGALVFASGGAATPLGALGSAVASQLPGLNIPISENFTISLSPSIVTGSGFGLGVNVGASFNSPYGSIGFSLGFTRYFEHFASGTSFLEERFGYGYMLGGKDFRFGLSTSNFSGGGFNQRTGSLNFAGDQLGGWSLSYENDGVPFGKNALGNGANPQTDHYRTAAVRGSIGDVSFGFNIFTGDRDLAKSAQGEPTAGYPYGMVTNASINDYKFAGLYIGINNYRIGWNHHKIGHTIQNKGAHSDHSIFGMKILKGQNWIPWNNNATFYPNKAFGGYYSKNPYTNW